MSALAITCDNCGAKYRLPESFSADKAKCQKCGSVIDVAAQRKAAAATPTMPAIPASAPTPRSQPTRAKDKAEAPRRTARTTSAVAAEPKAARGRKEPAERAPKKNNTMLLAGGGIAALAIVAVIVVLASGGKDKPAGTEVAQATAASAAVANQEPAASTTSPTPAPAEAKATPVAAEAAASKPAPETAEASMTTQDKKPAAAKPADTKPAADAKPVEPKAEPTPAAKEEAQKQAEAEAKPSGEIKERWEANKTTSLADVYKPSVLGDVSWPAECEQAQKDEIVSLIEDVCGGGKPGIAAKPKLEKIGYYAIFGLVDRLRKLDYSSGDDQMTAWELNKLIETIASGMNAGFVAVEAGGDLDPRKADHNARTNVAWDRLLTKFQSKADFDTWRKERQSKSK